MHHFVAAVLLNKTLMDALAEKMCELVGDCTFVSNRHYAHCL